MKAYHRVTGQQPFQRLSLDILGPYKVKASNTSRAIIKLHSLLVVCLSTGLLTQILMDGADLATVVRSKWLIQLRYNVQVEHIHTDAGSAFSKLGDVAEVMTEKASQGEFLRLLLLLQSFKQS